MGAAERIAAVTGLAIVLIVTTASRAQALAITPPSAANLGTYPAGTTSISHQLGPITVTASGSIVFPSFVATVSTTTFTNATGQAIGTASISYWSGPATNDILNLQNATPGQIDAAHAQALSTPVTAFASTGLVLVITTVWNPTIVIAIPPAAVAGTYTGTITHSVA